MQEALSLTPQAQGQILVVEDDEMFRDYLEEFLNDSGFSAKVVENAPAAREIFLKNPFDLVITDLNMPGGDGFELCQWIKKEKESTPVILITGYSEVGNSEKALKAGVSQFLEKTDVRKNLIESIQSCMKIVEESNSSDVKALDLKRLLAGQDFLFDLFFRN